MSKNKYAIPVEKDKMFFPISNTEAHPGILRNSVDFLMRSGIKVLAAAKGEVVDVKDDATEGGDNPKYADIKYQNYITIKHDEVEYSQYVHLAPNSVRVSVGDVVNEGDVIANGIDMIGCTTAPHLHFMVLEFKDNKEGFETLPISWQTDLKVYRDAEVQEELKKEKYSDFLNSLK